MDDAEWGGEKIRDAARRFMFDSLREQPGVNVSIGALDPRLRLAPCAQTLAAFWPQSSARLGRVTVGVRCEAPKPWTVYVPALITTKLTIVTARRPLARGMRISPEDIALVEQEVTALTTSYLIRAEDALGKIIKRPVAMGTALTPSLLESAPLVRRGQEVTLLANAPGVTVRMQGTAMSNGAEGDTIRVRGVNSKRVVEGKITGEGLVEIEM